MSRQIVAMSPGTSGVPFITMWSTERPLPTTVIERLGSGIGYLDETLGDRDENGVLWQRVPSRPGHGRPQFGSVHSLRQRRVMRRLLCGVCAGPPDRTAEGVLWLVRDYREDWTGWPEGMGATEPPVCLPCARRSARACPALRRGHVAVRVGHAPIAGVYGVRYQAGLPFPAAAEDATVALDDPTVRWIRAAQLVRELRGCTIVDWDALSQRTVPSAVTTTFTGRLDGTTRLLDGTTRRGGGG